LVTTAEVGDSNPCAFNEKHIKKLGSIFDSLFKQKNIFFVLNKQRLAVLIEKCLYLHLLKKDA
jgi:hypothetical protein